MRTFTFGQKITVIFITVVVLQGLFLSSVSYQQANKMILQNKKVDIADLVNRIDITINSNVRFATGQLESATGNQILLDYLHASSTNAPNMLMRGYLRDIMRSFPGAKNLLICSPSKVLNGHGRPDAGVPMAPSLKSIYQSAAKKQGEAVWLGLNAPFFVSAKAPLVLMVACAVQDPDTGDVLGMLLLEIDPQIFASLLLNNQNTFTNQYTFIVDAQGRLISSSKNMQEAWVQQVQQQFQQGARRFNLTWNGDEYYACGQYNGLTGWVSFSLIPMNSILAQTKGLRTLLLLFAILCTLVASIIVFVVTYTATKPLKQLSAAMEKTHDGNFSEQLHTRRRDEIGTLVKSYNFMLQRINELINEVYREKLAQKDAELEALQLQINPHFLYNTLDSISWMAINAGAKQVSQSVIALGKLMQYSLDNQRGPAHLSEELAYAESYLRLQKNRLEDKLQYEVDEDDALAQCLVPKLILQPIVENAITHGLASRPVGGRVSISVAHKGSDLHITVKDNGVGMREEYIQTLKDGEDIHRVGHTCIGMRNVDKRLRLHYGDAYGLQIASHPGKGTEVTLCIPVQKEGELCG